MVSRPLVSVCVVTYNHKDYINKCLDNILNQKTTFPFEIILGEDESTDGTRQICLDYANKYPDKIKLFLRSRKDVIYIGGQPTGRFNMIENLKACSGKYIALCEGDDYWTDPLKLQKQVDFMELHTEYNICFHRADSLNLDGSFTLHPVPESKNKNSYSYKDLLSHYNFITTASVLFRNLEDFNFPNWFRRIPFGDLAIYKLVLGDKSIYCIDEVMSVYRIHSQGAYSGLKEMKAKANYLTFYRLIYPALSTEEKWCVKNKYSGKLYELARLKFKKNKILRKLYYLYFSMVFKLSI